MPCWEWSLSKNADGYAQVYRRGGGWLVHKRLYELLRKNVDDGMELDHLCRNRGCVNPYHLEEVPHRENVMRGNGHRKVSEDDVVRMFKLRRQGIGCTELARTFGLTANHVSRILTGKSWSERLKRIGLDIEPIKGVMASKLTQEDLWKIQRMLVCGYSGREISNLFAISESRVSTLKKQNRWNRRYRYENDVYIPTGSFRNLSTNTSKRKGAVKRK